MDALAFLIYGFMLLILIFTLYVIVTRQTGLKLLMCKARGKSLLMLCSDDGALNLIPVAKPDINTLKNSGTWVFDRKSAYVLNGIPVYFGYVKGPAVTAPIEVHVAASKLKSLFIEPEINIRQTIFKAKQTELKQKFYDYISASKTKSEWAALRKDYVAAKDVRIKELSDFYIAVVGSPEDGTDGDFEDTPAVSAASIDCDDPFGYESIESFIAENMKLFPSDEVDFHMSKMSDDDYQSALNSAKSICTITPVDITAIMEYSNALNPHTISAKINRSVNERLHMFGFGSKVSGTAVTGFIILFVIVAIILYMFWTGSADSAVDAVVNVTDNVSIIGV
ncbi:MAG: hypothetical protein LBU81_06355 [Methanosarcinales archaeon]|jgi:hypothetical protein|nr:hypothetical protein [Methanosarcinales archaeon]